MNEGMKYFYEGPDYLKEYFLSLTNIVDNPLGIYNRQCVLNRLKTALPGEAVMTGWCNYGSYQNLFYPDSKPMPDQEKLDELTRISAETWGAHCVPFVCDTIYNVTRETRDYINRDKVSQDEKPVVCLMGNRHTAFYQYLLEAHENPTAAAYKKLSEEEKISGKKDYIRVITSPAWIKNKLIAKAEGNWPDPDWELYHHFNKMQILGASDSETSDAIRLLDSYGIIPECVSAQNWKQYDRWVTEGKAEGNLIWQDFEEARDAMNESRSVGQIYCTEIYSGLFMGDGNPGLPYWRKPPDVSCFSFNTMVRMDGGLLKRICDVRPGDQVATPRGTKKVMMISMPLRGNRTLCQFPEHQFRFTQTHPFVTEEGFACADPAALCAAVPTFRRETVNVLGTGSRLHTPFGEKPVAVRTEKCLDEMGSEDELLYDVIPEPADGYFQYYAGDETTQYLVSSEVPSIAGREHMARAFMIIFNQIACPILDKTAHIKEREFWGLVQPRLIRYVKTELPSRYALYDRSAKSQSQAERQRQEKKQSQEEEGEQSGGTLFSAYAGFFSDSKMNIRIGLLFSAAFAAFLPLLMSMDFTLSEADSIGAIIAGDIDSMNF